MATTTIIALQDILFGGYRVTAQANQLAESMTTAQLESNALGDETMLYTPGLKGYGFSGEGFFLGSLDAGLEGYHRTSNVPVTVALTTGAAGTPCRSVKAMVGEHAIIEGAHGELATFSFAIGAMDSPVRGYMLHIEFGHAPLNDEAGLLTDSWTAPRLLTPRSELRLADDATEEDEHAVLQRLFSASLQDRLRKRIPSFDCHTIPHHSRRLDYDRAVV